MSKWGLPLGSGVGGVSKLCPQGCNSKKKILSPLFVRNHCALAKLASSTRGLKLHGTVWWLCCYLTGVPQAWAQNVNSVYEYGTSWHLTKLYKLRSSTPPQFCTFFGNDIWSVHRGGGKNTFWPAKNDGDIRLALKSTNIVLNWYMDVFKNKRHETLYIFLCLFYCAKCFVKIWF